MLEIRRAETTEADRLTEIAHTSKRHWGYPESWIRAWERDLTVEPDFVAAHEVHTAIVDGQSAGFFALQRKPEGSMEVEHFWVMPDCMGQGVGKALFRHAVEIASAGGASGLDILSDPHAEPFYKKMGARTVGRVDASIEGTERYLPKMRYDL